MWVKPTSNLSGALLGKMDEKAKHRGYDVWMEGGRPGMHIIHAYPENAIKVVSKTPLPLNVWNHLCVTYDGSGKAAGINIFVNGQASKKTLLRTTSLPPSRQIKPSGLVAATTEQQSNGVEIDEIGLYHRVLNHKDVEKLSKVDTLSPLFEKPLDTLANAQRTLLHDEYLNRFDKGV